MHIRTVMPLSILGRLLSRPLITRYRNWQLHRLIRHAYRNVQYYRKLFRAAGISPADIRSVRDLHRIPISSKEDIRSLSPETIVSRKVAPERLIVRKTSGSTGQPMTIRRSWFEERLLQQFRHMALFYLGHRPTYRMASIALIRTTHPRDRQLFMDFANRLGLYRQQQIDCRQPLDDICRKLIDFSPDIIHGFSGAVYQVADRFHSAPWPRPRPRLVTVGGEVLTPTMQNTIADVFKTPVFQLYGSHEFNLLAWQCRHGELLHVNEDGLILEILKDGRPVGDGQTGEVVATNLHAYTMPFIRYRLGDFVTKGPPRCSCGQQVATIKSIQGRMLDYFRLPNGRLLHSYEISIPVRRKLEPIIRQYQLIQEKENRIVMRISLANTLLPEDKKAAEDAIRAIVGKDVVFTIVEVDHIQRESSGKFRVAKSLVTSPYDKI